MSTMSLRLSESLHRAARELAAREGISVNQLVSLALAEKISALATEDYLKQRVQRGERSKFERAMAHVADVEPEERDSL